MTKATILIDNTSEEALLTEWGLSVFIEHNGRKILLDTGSSGKFSENASVLGISLSEVEYAVLSHAHYDHSDGFERFFELNTSAKLYLQSGTEENCYSGEGADRHYIGIKQGTLERFADRIEYVHEHKLFDGAYIIPHRYDMEMAGRQAHMYLYKNGEWTVDCFHHEQSLVLDTEKGLVVFNSCCHGGADVIINEISEAFGKEVYALVGGLHLFRSNDEKVIEMAERLKKTGIKRIYTGHCTGERAFQLLENRLGDILRPISSGSIIEF